MCEQVKPRPWPPGAHAVTEADGEQAHPCTMLGNGRHEEEKWGTIRGRRWSVALGALDCHLECSPSFSLCRLMLLWSVDLENSVQPQAVPPTCSLLVNSFSPPGPRMIMLDPGCSCTAGFVHFLL